MMYDFHHTLGILEIPFQSRCPDKSLLFVKGRRGYCCKLLPEMHRKPCPQEDGFRAHSQNKEVTHFIRVSQRWCPETLSPATRIDLQGSHSS